MAKLKIKHNNDSVLPINLQGIQLDDTTVIPQNFLEINAYFLQKNTSGKKGVFSNIEDTNRDDNYGLLAHVRNRDNYYLSKISKRGILGLVLDKCEGNYSGTTALMSAMTRGVSTCTSNYYEDSEIENIKSGLSSVVKKIMSFSALKKNWDSYNAEPILWDTIFRAVSFFTKVIAYANKRNKKGIPVPFIAPVANGGINFEWRTCFHELVLEIPENTSNEIEYLLTELTIDGNKETSGNTSDADYLASLTVDWLL